jgi:5-formyltetrahydrofolate cyclo-ligase
MVSEEKEKLRGEISAAMEARESGSESKGWGKAAERLRHMEAYHIAQNAMISPAASLLQARLNILVDRKRLIMATPGLQKGFFLFEPDAVPVSKRLLAVRAPQDSPFAKKLSYDASLAHPVDLIVADALAVSPDGNLLGDGRGHLDLQLALLAALHWLHPQVQIVALVREEQILPSIPAEATDAGAHWIVTPREVYETGRRELPRNGIVWEKLTLKQIRRNDALFHLYKRMNPLTP